MTTGITELAADLAMADLIDDDADWMDFLTEDMRAMVASGGTFCIEDDASADWYLKILGRIEAELDALNAQYMARVERLAKQKESFNKRFREQFDRFVCARIEEPGFKGETLHLGYGSAAVTSFKERLAVMDEAAAMEFARKSVPAAVSAKVVESLVASAYLDAAQQAMNDTGEIFPGVEIVPARDSVAIKWPEAQK